MPDQNEESPVTITKWSDQGQEAVLNFDSDQRIRTVDEAIRYAEVDLTTWYVKDFEVGSYEVTLKCKEEVAGEDGKPRHRDRPVRKTMWRVRLRLARLRPQPLQEAVEALYRRMEQLAPRYAPRVVPAVPARERGRHLLELGLYDIHFGKLAWAPETGENYDLKIADQIYARAVADMIEAAAGYAIDRYLLVIGNDFFHFDNLAYQTVHGTLQDSDSRYAKIIEVGSMALVHAVEQMIARAPVDLLLVPGNHDRLSSFHLARFVAAWFRNSDSVRVDISPRVRKYYRYGRTLLGFTHGDCGKPAELPAVMATEVPKEWAAATCREWHLGHLHKTKKLQSVAVDSHQGTVVRVLPSLAGTDAWHFAQNYITTRHAAEAYLYEHTAGYVGHFSAPARRSART